MSNVERHFTILLRILAHLEHDGRNTSQKVGLTATKGWKSKRYYKETAGGYYWN